MTPAPELPPRDADEPAARLVDRHLAVGLRALLGFVVLGLVLEGLHAVKSPTLLDAGQETVRLLLRLAHAHGTGLALVNLAYGAAGHARPRAVSPVGSACLVAATALVPGGFLLGAIATRGADPGAGVALVPAGAVLLVVALALAAMRLRRRA